MLVATLYVPSASSVPVAFDALEQRAGDFAPEHFHRLELVLDLDLAALQLHGLTRYDVERDAQQRPRGVSARRADR